MTRDMFASSLPVFAGLALAPYVFTQVAEAITGPGPSRLSEQRDKHDIAFAFVNRGDLRV